MYPAHVVSGGGKVIMEADISDRGRVVSARVPAPGGAFDSAALDAIRGWAFRPTARAGRPLGSRAFFVFSFPGVHP